MTSGSSRRGRRRRLSLSISLALLAATLPDSLFSQNTTISLPATRLDEAMTRIGRLGHVDVVSIEPGLARVRSHPVVGAASPRAALEAALEGTGYRLIALDAHSFRVVRGTAARPPAPRPPPRPPSDGPPDGAAPEVIVTASKQNVPLLRYPGSLTLIGGPPASGAANPGDLSDAARVTPVLQNTEFGPGRNKIFIRGIADSSFNGAVQSTASVYLGDVQLGYSGADPSIKLYDMKDVEVMEGPQGTLYGSGSIGGIVRLTPAPPVLDAIGGSVTAGVTATQGGAPGGDVAGMLNLPLLGDRAGLRAVAYRSRDGGFIDDIGTGRDAVNRIDTTGGRLALRVVPASGWRIDLGGLYQRIDAADAQYVDHTVGPLERMSAFPQPYDNEILLGSAAVSKDWASGLQFVSVVGFSSYHAHNTFDASSPPLPGQPFVPTIYVTDDAKTLLSGETRLSRTSPGGSGWVVGFTLLRNSDGENRALGVLATPADIIGVTNVTKSASAFAEGTLALWPSLSVTLGARFTYARVDGEPSYRPRVNDYVQGRSTKRVDPTAAFSWKLAPSLTVFGRAQTGYRTGGLAVARGVGRVADFQSDSIRVGEIGLRWLRRGETGLSLTSALSFARWTAIQADLVNRRGLPYTANIGDAHVEAFEGTADWVPVRGLRGVLSFLQTRNTTSGELSDSSSPAHRRLPDTPPFAITADVSYHWSVGARDTVLVGASGMYEGRSVLGTGDLFDLDQGQFSTFGARLGWQRGRIEMVLAAENLANTRGNLFATGNPFELVSRNLATPLRPRNVRLGAKVSW